MRQRVMIAMALSCNPALLIADEPTTALDVTVQAQILKLMRELKREFGTAIILITHDMGVVADIAERVAVMYAGRVVEEAPKSSLFRNPQHPYTWGLLESMPTVEKRLDVLIPIEGSPPSLLHPPPGCPFHPRCKYRFAPCDNERPPFVAIPGGHPDACHLPAERKRELWENRIATELGLLLAAFVDHISAALLEATPLRQEQKIGDDARDRLQSFLSHRRDAVQKAASVGHFWI